MTDPTPKPRPRRYRRGRAGAGLVGATGVLKWRRRRPAPTQAQLSRQIDDLHHLHGLSVLLLEASGLEKQLRLILTTLARFHGSETGLALLCEAHGGPVQAAASLGLTPEAARAAAAATAHLTGHPCLTRSRIVIEDTRGDPRAAWLADIARRSGIRAMHSTPLLSPEGEILGALVIFLPESRPPTARECTLADICARKAILFIERTRTRKALLDSQGRFEAVLQASGAPFVIVEPVRDGGAITDFRWAYLNRAAGRVLGQPPSDLIGRQVLATLADLSADSEEFHHCVKAIETGRVVEFDMVQGGERKTRWFHCIASPIHDSLAIWFTDISSRVRRDRRKDEFLATLAHELRSPLAPILQALALLMSGRAPEEQRRWAIEVANRQVRRMALLLEDLLDLPRISHGILKLRKTRVRLDDVIAVAIETARPNIDAGQHRLSVHAGTVPVTLEADALRLAQVVANLLNNAAKYTDPGGRIDLSVRRQAAEVLIEVKDNGIGISPASIPHMFRMFSRLRHAGDRAEAGLGIGLALSRGLVELHGGTLTAQSRGPGKGSVFTARLPLAKADPPPALPAPAAPAAPPRKVLIADDNHDAADTLAALLVLEGHTVQQAYDGREALQLWRSIHHDVCLLDIGMAGCNGYEVARAIRACPEGRAVLLVAVTGWSQSRDRQEALKAGFDLHLTKPVTPEQIERLLGGLPPSPEAPATGAKR